MKEKITRNCDKVMSILLIILNMVGFIQFMFIHNLYKAYPVGVTLLVTLWFIFKMPLLDKGIRKHKVWRQILDAILFTLFLMIPIIISYIVKGFSGEILMWILVSTPLFYVITFNEVMQDIAGTKN